MKIHLLTALVFAMSFGVATAQDAPQPVPSSPFAAQPSSPTRGDGQRGGRGAWGGGMGMAGGRGLIGTVSEVAADHYNLRTDAGETYTVHFSANTRILKQAAGQGRGQGGQRGGPGGTPPEAIKPGEIKVGDVISAMGEVDASAKSLGAVVVFLMDPERAKQMREMQANFGKTWLMGKVTAISDLTVTLQSSVDNASHKFAADENTSFRKRRDPITLGDIQIGDMVRVEGSIENGAFVAASVGVMGAGPAGGPGDPRAGVAGADSK